MFDDVPTKMNINRKIMVFDMISLRFARKVDLELYIYFVRKLVVCNVLKTVSFSPLDLNSELL